MVGSYAVGDVWALVPPRKAVWSLPGKSKATGKTFFLLLFLCFITVPLFYFSYFSSHFILYLVYYYIFLLPVFILFHFIFYA